MIFVFLIAILISSFSFSASECNSVFPVEIKYKIVNSVGEQYRKADVVIYIPVLTEYSEVKKTNEDIPKVKLEFKAEKSRALTSIQATKPLKGDLLLIQPIKRGFVHEEAQVRKILSFSPLIEEVFLVYPVDVTKNYISFPLPPISLGEKLIVEYKFEGSLDRPYVKYSKPSDKQEYEQSKVFLTVKYSFFFRYANAYIKDENAENVKALLRELQNYGISPRVEVIGFADGKSTNPKRNEEIAKKRALEVAKRIFPESVLSCLDLSTSIVKLSP